MSKEEVRRRTLCMVVHAHFPLGEPRVQREARAAHLAGYEVHVVALRGDDEPQNEIVDGIRVHRVGISHKRGVGLARILREYVGFTVAATVTLARLDRRHRFDVVHVHAPPDFLIASSLIPRLRGARVVMDIHDLSSHLFGARFGATLGARVCTVALEAIERAACAYSSRVITVHEAYRQELVRHGVPADKICVVMNAADEQLIERARDESSAHAVGGFELAYHGTITHWYGVDLLVRAVAQLAEEMPDVRAVILGEGDALNDVRRLARELGVADRVEFSGRYLPIGEALARVARSACGVIPNRPTTLNRFALSSKLFEYVALGLPVVVSRLETLAAHFNENEVEFFDPGDARALAAALRRVAAAPAEAAHKAQRARQRADDYSWTINAERYVALLASLSAV